jgi:class 3 adenylate cyclase
MRLKEDLESEVAEIFRESWSERDGRDVPDPEDLGFGNDAVNLDGTVLYADLSGSTKLVDAYKPQFPAEVYKTYLRCAARIVKSESGSITAYDGDRIMAVFLGNSKNSSAGRAGLKINYAVKNIINPAIEKQYPNVTYRVKHTVGIDTSPLFVARIGVRNDNDLVWVGRAANYAAKLTEIAEDNTVFATEDAYDKFNAKTKTSVDGRAMWEKTSWTKMDDMTIYRSTWTWPPDY